MVLGAISHSYGLMGAPLGAISHSMGLAGNGGLGAISHSMGLVGAGLGGITDVIQQNLGLVLAAGAVGGYLWWRKSKGKKMFGFGRAHFRGSFGRARRHRKHRRHGLGRGRAVGRRFRGISPMWSASRPF